MTKLPAYTMIAALSLMLTGCGIFGSTRTIRVDSSPGQAKMSVWDGSRLVGVYTLNTTIDNFDDDYTLVIEHEGYHRFEGSIKDLDPVANDSYQVRLRPLDAK